MAIRSPSGRDIFGFVYDRTRSRTGQQLDAVVHRARRKAALNWAQLEFVKQTECLRQENDDRSRRTRRRNTTSKTRQDFYCIAKEGISIQITPTTGSVRYIEGDDLTRTTVER
jgi:hypothetical protein